VGWFFGGKKEEEEEEEELDPVQFKGAMNGAEPDMKANEKLLRAGLDSLKDLITEGLDVRADTIRLDPKGPQAVATFLIDGMPKPAGRFPKNEGMAITQTIKLLAGLDPKVRNTVQAGGVKAEWENKKYQLMVSVLPTADGEKLTIRCNDVAVKMNTPADLGMSEAMRQKIREVGTGKGVLCVTGVPGSGTTTTMFATLRGVDPYLYSVFSIGDQQGRPLEKDNITCNFPILPADNLATTLERMARVEANIVHLSSPKDADTVKQIFSQADKLLLIFEFPSKDVTAAVQQLIEWVGDPKVVAEHLRGVISQKLLRMLCKDCKQAFRPKADFIKKAGLPEATTTLYRKATVPEEEDAEYEACEKCGEVGYIGRTALFEFLVNTDEMKPLIEAGADPSALRQQMRKEKMTTLQSDALRLVADGKTSLEEVQRVLKPA